MSKPKAEYAEEDDRFTVRLQEISDDLAEEKDKDGNQVDNGDAIYSIAAIIQHRHLKATPVVPINGPAIQTEEFKEAEQASKDSLKDETKVQK
jgi:hypothetical protein